MAYSRIHFLGNSITLHPPAADLDWSGNWGMAASAPDHDYVHLVLQHLTEANGKATQSLVVNIADFERGYTTADPEVRFQAAAEFKPDLLILAIGENVPALNTEEDKVAFQAVLLRMFSRLTRDNQPTIVVRSTFWADPVKDGILKAVCHDVGGTFVDISSLAGDSRNFAHSERSFQNAGVGAHPGDTGMAAIAEAIWNAIPARSAVVSR